MPCKVMPLVTEVQLVLDKHSQLGSWKIYRRMGVNELKQLRGWHHLVASIGPCGHTIHLLTTSSQTTMANPSTYYWWMCVRVNITPNITFTYVHISYDSASMLLKQYFGNYASVTMPRLQRTGTYASETLNQTKPKKPNPTLNQTNKP